MLKKDLFYCLQEKWEAPRGEQTDHLTNYLKRVFKDEEQILRKYATRFISDILSKWQKPGQRKLDRFLATCDGWLNGKVQMGNALAQPSTAPAEADTSSAGRPNKNFSELSYDAKRKRVAGMVQSSNSEELTFAASMRLRSDGKSDAAVVVRETLASPGRASKIRKAWEDSKTVALPRAYTVDQALALKLDLKLTKDKYINLRKSSISQNAPLYPTYDSLKVAIKACYPSNITITESEATVGLQAMVDHFVERLLAAQSEVLEVLTDDQKKNMILISKWGFDGKSGHSEYKQKSETKVDDSKMFMTSWVPLQLYCMDQSRKIIVWQNPRPGSPRFCRPLRIAFEKETPEKTPQARVESQIMKLIPSEAHSCRVVHELHLTMLDGKACNSITETLSTQRCFLCQATQSQFNNLEAMKTKTVVEGTLHYGLSTLHCWLRTMDFILKLSYQMKQEGDKTVLEKDDAKQKEKKKEVQTQFREETGLLVDVVKQGMGTSNDGNSARTFFDKIDVTARITGVDKGVIERLSNLLHAVSSPYEINVAAFRQYAWATAEALVNLYPWKKMTPTVHKLLIHGADIIAAAPLPIGLFTEEAQESRNKDVTNYRVLFTRKTSREACMEDMVHMLLQTSDPLINSLRVLPKRKAAPVAPGVVFLLKEPQLHAIEVIDGDWEEDEDL